MFRDERNGCCLSMAERVDSSGPRDPETRLKRASLVFISFKGSLFKIPFMVALNPKP